jgi:5-methylcytosine-specific restriction endonuclease McrA
LRFGEEEGMSRYLSILAVLLALCVTALASPTPYQVKQAMASYRASHPACEVCGKSGSLLHPLEVHHIHPREAFPNEAADTNNFIMACRPCHTWVCHPGRFDLYTDDLRAWLKARKVKENKP